jgi:hypothetical protein
LLLWLKTQPDMATIPFFVISGRLDAQTRLSMEQAGVTGIFIKGGDFNTTVEQMRAILAHLPPKVP